SIDLSPSPDNVRRDGSQGSYSCPNGQPPCGRRSRPTAIPPGAPKPRGGAQLRPLPPGEGCRNRGVLRQGCCSAACGGRNRLLEEPFDRGSSRTEVSKNDASARNYHPQFVQQRVFAGDP